MKIITGTSRNIHSDLISCVARYRYRVFVEKLGWRMNCKVDMEQDQFDRDDTVHVIALNDRDDIIGSARLLPTTRPYLLGTVFPQLLGASAPPASADVWELSRFAAVDFGNPDQSALSQFSSAVAVSLLRQSINCAASRGAQKLITVSPVGVERLLRRNGFTATRAGSPVIVDGNFTTAYWIDCIGNLQSVTPTHPEIAELAIDAIDA